MRWLLIRHGESVGNREWRLQGQREFPMNERGRRQAELLARRLAGVDIAAVYGSPIRRAWETAQAIARSLGLAVQALVGVQEYDFGELSGLTWSEIQERAPEVTAAIASRSDEYPHYPGEEGRDAFRRRVCTALWGLQEKHGDETVVVVAHAGPIAVFLLDVLGLPYRPPLPFNLDNGSITLVETPPRQWPGAPPAVLVSLNDVCHLKEEG
jgi:broad specificity phosphatase PhoE